VRRSGSARQVLKRSGAGRGDLRKRSVRRLRGLSASRVLRSRSVGASSLRGGDCSGDCLARGAASLCLDLRKASGGVNYRARGALRRE
jgi:hypothetical protein